MKIIDENGRINGKFSIVDLAVILLLLACIAAVGLKMRTSQTVRGGDRVIEYAVRIENIRDMSVNAMNQNREGVIDAETKYALGDIIDVDTAPARVLVQTNDGDFQFAEYDNRYDAVITLRTEGTETDDGYYAASGKQLAVGDTIGVNNGYVQFFGEVISVNVSE